MRIVTQRITIIRTTKPATAKINEDLQWFFQSLGLLGLRDKDQSCYRIFIELLKSAKKGHPMTSDELAFKLNLSRGTVMHHINKLMQAGIVINQKNTYVLRADNLCSLTEELEKDMQRTVNDIKEMAKKIDGELNI